MLDKDEIIRDLQHIGVTYGVDEEVIDTWAKSYRLQGIQIEGQESWRAGWLYHLCEDIVVKIERNWTVQTRLNEEEKAQMFIGYLAAFPKSEKNEIKIEEDTVNEQ